MMRTLNKGATYVKGLLMLKKIVRLGKNLNVIIVKILDMFKKIAGTKQVSKQTSQKKMKVNKAHYMHVKLQKSKGIMCSILTAAIAIT